MLLVEVTFDDVLYRVSNAICTLTHFWDAKIASMSDVKYTVATVYGGYVKPTYGTISLTPDMFTGLDSYPVSGTIKVMYTNTTEEEAEDIMTASIILNTIDRKSIQYTIYADTIEDKVTDKTYSGTLIDIFTDVCSSLEEPLELDSTYAREDSPTISYTASGEKLVLDNLSNMAKFSTHLFYIRDGVLVLIDMDNFTETAPITEFDVFPSGYTYDPPVSLYKTGSDDTEATVDGTYVCNDNEMSISPQCNTNVAESEDVLERIKVIVEKPRIRLNVPLDYVYKIGSQITLTDESQEITLNIIANIRSLSFNFDNDTCVLIGEGTFV